MLRINWGSRGRVQRKTSVAFSRDRADCKGQGKAKADSPVAALVTWLAWAPLQPDKSEHNLSCSDLNTEVSKALRRPDIRFQKRSLVSFRATIHQRYYAPLNCPHSKQKRTISARLASSPSVKDLDCLSVEVFQSLRKMAASRDEGHELWVGQFTNFSQVEIFAATSTYRAASQDRKSP